MLLFITIGLCWAEERKIGPSDYVGNYGNWVKTPSGICSSRLCVSEIVPIDKEIVKVVYHIIDKENGSIVYYTEYIKPGDKYYERIIKTGDTYNVYTLKHFNYNVLEFDIEVKDIKYSDFTFSY